MMRSMLVLSLFAVIVHGTPVSPQTRANVVHHPRSSQFVGQTRHGQFPLRDRGSPSMRPQWSAMSWNPFQARAETSETPAKAETSETPAVAVKETGGPLKFVSIYETELDKCLQRPQRFGSTSKTVNDYCSYRSAEVAEHQVCVAEAKKGDEPTWDEEGLFAECRTIWDVGKDDLTSYMNKDLRQGVLYNVQLVPKCSALPAGVLESKYTLAEWNGCDKKTRVYEPMGPGPGVRTFGKTNKCMRFRAAIETICETCALQAPSEKAKASLLSKCEALKSSALTEEDVIHHDALSISFFALASFFTSGLSYVLIRLGRSATTIKQEPLLA